MESGGGRFSYTNPKQHVTRVLSSLELAIKVRLLKPNEKISIYRPVIFEWLFAIQSLSTYDVLWQTDSGKALKIKRVLGK
jgi:hypothetical protein